MGNCLVHVRAYGSPPAAPRVYIECTLRGRAVRGSLKDSKDALSARSPDDSRDARDARGGYQAQVRALRGAFSKESRDRREEDGEKVMGGEAVRPDWTLSSTS